MSRLSAVIPIQTDNFSFYASRLAFRSKYGLRDVETIIVDYGSGTTAAKEIETLCKATGYTYLRVEADTSVFSLSKSRNAGIRHATTEWVVMEDADVVYPSDFYHKLLQELELLECTPFNFLTLPVVYLSSRITEEVLGDNTLDSAIARIQKSMLLENPRGGEANDDIQHYASASAIIAMRRKTAFQVGLYDEEFSGWGGEDRDFIFRLLAANCDVQKPPFFHETSFVDLNDTVGYRGWRSLYLLHGTYMAAKGLYGFHLFHEVMPWRLKGSGVGYNNLKIAAEKARQHTFSFPEPDLQKGADVIVGTSPYIANDYVCSVLSNPVIIDDSGLSLTELVNRVFQYQLNTVLMFIPKNCERMYEIHDLIIQKGMQPIVAFPFGENRILFADSVEGGDKQGVITDQECSFFHLTDTGAVGYRTLVIPSFPRVEFRRQKVSLQHTILFDRYRCFENYYGSRSGVLKGSLERRLQMMCPDGVYNCDGCSSFESFVRFFMAKCPKLAERLRSVFNFLSLLVGRNRCL